MLDKNMDWARLLEKPGVFDDLAEKCMRQHRESALPNYTMVRSQTPPEHMFATPDRLEGSLGKMDTTQLMRVGEYGNDTAQAAWVRDTHSLDYCHVKMHVQPVGMVVKNHFDANRTLLREHGGPFGTLDVVKVLHFLTDWHMGQVIMMGEQCITDWRAGDAVTFPWYMEHATANANEAHERAMLFIAGLRLQN